ncbi:MAG: SCO family protein [Burkholderiales bacterium]
MHVIRGTALAATCALAGCYAEHPKFKSIDVTGADWGRALELTDHGGKPRTLADFRGKITVVTFGFTNCPDVCPTTLADAAQALKSLGRNAGRVQLVFVTLDPERDTPDVLAKYVPAFDPSFIGLRGGLEATRRVAKEFKIFFEKRPASSGRGYSVDHSAQSYVLDASGRLRLLVKHERIASDLAHDVRELLKEKR